MSLNTYGDIIPQPPPVTTGTTVQSYTDPNGDVWVAKNGIYAGAWKRAREVCAARIFSNANQTFSAGTVIGLGGTNYDPLAMKSGNNWVIPIAGRYAIIGAVGLNGAPTTAGQIQSVLYYNAAQSTQGSVSSFGASQTAWPASNVSDILFCNAGDTVGLFLYTSGASVTTLGNSPRTFVGITYEGTN